MNQNKIQNRLRIAGATLITGADSDIGMAYIREATGDVLAHYFAYEEKLRFVETKARVVPVYGDLSTIDGIDAFLERLLELQIPVARILHLPSSPATPVRLSKFDPERYHMELNIQVVSAAKVFGVFLPEMAKEGFGRVAAALTSYCLGVPPKFLTTYVSAKYALMGLLKSAAIEYAGKGITINAVAPSMTETKFLSTLPDFEIERAAASNPSGRNATPADIVPVLQMLLDNQNEFMTGSVIPITGGEIF